MRAAVRITVSILLTLLLAACSGDAPAPAADAPSAASPSAVPPPASTALANLDTAALRERASASLAANRLYAPAGDNAVEDYLALRERQPEDSTVATALVDLAPYVMIGAEQATAAGAFTEATRLIELMARMDPDAPAVPRLREALTSAQAVAEAQVAAEQAEALRLDADAERRRAEAASSAIAAAEPAPAPARAAAPPPIARPLAAQASVPAPPPAAPRSAAPSATPTAGALAPPPTARALVTRVQPRFPEAAARRRLDGEVELAVSIRADGSVEGVDVVRADPPGVFDREAVLAVRRWRYAPAAAPSQARVVLQFKRP